MTSHAIGILHPGDMGISVAASAQNNGHRVYWVSAHRSAETKGRAEKFNLIDAHSLDELCQTCDMLISVCPPHASELVARDVQMAGFQGLYVDANAISPQRATALGQMLAQAGIDFVDGGIIGGPAWEPDRTWLYLSGGRAAEVAACFAAGPLMTQVLDEQPGTASALKMCFAAYTKGTTALLSAILATAESLGVREALFEQWNREGGDFAGQTVQRARRVTAKAWRFEGEMEEIAATFQAAGLPGGFHEAAAEVYRRLAKFKGAETVPSLEEVLRALLQTEK
ncbi:MAG: DUF1932 domain-containing protein [Anaerolineales bacterium]|nr:DUF1932 domain-containing protein [Anaerolineales bacterium]